MKLTGDWDKARRAMEGGGRRLNRAIDRAVYAEAQYLRKEIVLQIRDQRDFKPLSPWTIAKRKLAGFGGTKALIRRGDLLGSIGVVKVGDDEVFVGIPRSAQGKHGTSGDDLVRIGAVHEYGTDPIIIPLTPRLRRLLGALIGQMRKSGIPPPPTSGEPAKGAVVVQIPARPFLRPAFDRWRVGVRRRLIRRIGENMGWI